MKRSRGFSIAELLVALFVTSLAIGGAFGAYVMIQKFWISGNIQVSLNADIRTAINSMIRNIREGVEAQVLNGGDRLRVRYDVNDTPYDQADDVWRQYDFANNQIVYTPESGAPELVADNVYGVSGTDVFTLTGTNVRVAFRVYEAASPAVYRGAYIESSATLRNER
jgi:type II secretory pathway pseudopilin PulG